MKIYQILENLYYGGEIEVPDGTQGIPLYTTRTAPPEIPNGMFGRWNGSGWDVTDQPPPMDLPIVDPAPEITTETTDPTI